jgi:uncharacterized membrane protein YgdD (TMEM256/DUF423 family)
MRTIWFSIGAALMALAVVAGALGAHSLRRVLEPPALALWETATRYLVIGAVGLLATGLAAEVTGTSNWNVVGLIFAAGTAIFTGTVFALALRGPRWLGAVTPLGGLALIAGFFLLAVRAWPRHPGWLP